MSTITCPNCNQLNRSTSRYCAGCGEALPGDVITSADMSGGLPKLKDGIILEGRYRIVSELGRGGFGAVYQAWDLSLNHICAIKENLETSEEAQRQFTREAMVLANLIHRNLPRVTDHFIVPGQGQYLVMDFIEGDDLESLMEIGSTLPQQMMGIGIFSAFARTAVVCKT